MSARQWSIARVAFGVAFAVLSTIVDHLLLAAEEEQQAQDRRQTP